MENRDDLSDIILEKDKNGPMKAKRILIIVALLIVILLVVLVMMKVINKSSNQDSDQELVLPPTPIVNTSKSPQSDDELFKQVPITKDDGKKESFEEMVKNLKAKEAKKEKDIKPLVEKITSVKVPKIRDLEKENTKKKKNIDKVKKIVKKVPKKIVDTVKKVAKNSSLKGVYVQVGATSRLKPSKKFLNKLTSKNYSYKLLPMDIKGTKVTKILIGPFLNIKTARQKLINIKSTINKNAFIYKVK